MEIGTKVASKALDYSQTFLKQRPLEVRKLVSYNRWSSRTGVNGEMNLLKTPCNIVRNYV